ncbi:MAG TPA: class A beta-lactamase-related serine hydrolase [Porticoccaceae bacterium]|nr:class A beta-lactamase-related serine hydrolase [Gammaproteobacteria bacterium]HIL60495.1 class A beta-lactamase-related serine hydrolase [Porticoccaceae bacterium]
MKNQITFAPLLTLVLTFCLSITAIADHHDEASNLSSIKPIHSTNFGIDQADIEKIVAQMQAAVDGEFIPGALLLVGNSDGVGVLETVGMQSPGRSTPVNKDTLFRIYSMTKPIISVATLSMVEEGLIALNDPVSKYIPEFDNLRLIDQENGDISSAKNVMTVENLLTHESGLIQEIFSPNSTLGQMYGENIKGNMTARELAGTLGKLPVFFEPGSAWHYGHSTDVLGAVIEVAAGKPLDVLLYERIFGPLGMNETTFFVPVSKKFRIAEPIHGAMSDNTIVRPLLSGGGGLNSTTEDYVRFAEMLLNNGEYRGSRIIEESTLELMLEKRIGPEVSREFFFYGNTGDWGLGFHLQPTDGTNANGPHNYGWRGIGGTIFIIDEENDFYMIYMEQKRGGPRGAPFDNNVAQLMVYEAMRN